MDEVEKSWDLLDILGVRRRRIRTDQGAFRHGICRAVQSEQDAYEEMISGRANIPEDDSPRFFVARCGERHNRCGMWREDQLEVLTQEERKARTVDLNILGVCRQLYEEANHLLWATNVFSFDDSVSFDKFIGSLNPAQKRNLTGLHLHTKIGCWNYSYDMASLENWATAFKMPYINMLRDVQTLHICFEQRFKRSYGPSPDSTYNRSKRDQDADVKPFLRLRALPTKNVTVVVSDNIHAIELDEVTEWRWTTAQKMECAKSIRSQLLDPQGAELVRAEAEAEQQAMRVNRADSVCRKAIHADKQVIRMKESAAHESKRIKHYEELVESARQKLEEATHKDGKGTDELQTAYEQSKLALSWVMGRVNRAAATAEHARIKAGDIAAKYQRAKARVGNQALVAKVTSEKEVETEDDDDSYAEEEKTEETEDFELMSKDDSADEVEDAAVQMDDHEDTDNESELSDDSS